MELNTQVSNWSITKKTSKSGMPATRECKSHIYCISNNLFLYNNWKSNFSEECLKKKCEYYFNVDALAHIDNPHTLKLLIEQNRPVVAPMMVFIYLNFSILPIYMLKMWFFSIQIRPYQAWSNFWGSLTTDGFYARSIDYMEIVKGERRWEISLLNLRHNILRIYLNCDRLLKHK